MSKTLLYASLFAGCLTLIEYYHPVGGRVASACIWAGLLVTDGILFYIHWRIILKDIERRDLALKQQKETNDVSA